MVKHRQLSSLTESIALQRGHLKVDDTSLQDDDCYRKCYLLTVGGGGGGGGGRASTVSPGALQLQSMLTTTMDR